MIPDSEMPADVSVVDDPDRFDAIAEAACERLARNEPVRRNLPGDGRLRIDRQLPFLCVHRSPPGAEDAGTRQLVTTEAAYLFASGEERYHAGLERLCQRISEAMQEHFGRFLLLEIWAEPLSRSAESMARSTIPAFEVVTTHPDALSSTLEAFMEALSGITIQGRRAIVGTRAAREIRPPGLTPIAQHCPEPRSDECRVLGVAVHPIFREAPGGPIYPVVLQRLRWQLSGAIRQAVARFTGMESTNGAVHFESLGPSSMVKAARIADHELCDVAESFDFLLQVTPTNSEHAWKEFSEGGYRHAPTLYYRPLPYHPTLLKRRLFDIEIERIEDPTLAHIYWEKQDEVDRQLTALREIETSRFLDSSRQLYGDADGELVQLAEAILDRQATAADQQDGAEGTMLTVRELVDRARHEIDHYYQQLSAFNASVEICDNIAAGIMVSHDRLLIADNLQVPPEHVEPLLHHEIGTHLLTYFNGRCQPFRQLYSGLAGYDELQEGLAILSEFLCGGLTAGRLRTLAGRVMAVQSLLEGDAFTETFERLYEGHGIPARQSFVTTLRAHRAGGMTKDVIYLRGLRDLLNYLGAGHDIEPLYVGKIGLHHLPYVQELRRRGIIHAPTLLPRFWDSDAARERLESCRGLTPLELLEATP